MGTVFFHAVQSILHPPGMGGEVVVLKSTVSVASFVGPDALSAYLKLLMAGRNMVNAFDLRKQKLKLTKLSSFNLVMAL